MKATIWHNPDCGTSRKTLAILQETPGIDLSVIEYKKVPFERAKLEQLFRDAGLSPREALRTRGSPAEELGLIDGADGELMVKVNIGDDRHRRLGTDGAETLKRGLGGHAHAHDIAASLRQRAHLRKRCLVVSGIGAGHGLDHHRRAATDLHTAHMHGTRQLARQRMG